MSMAACAVLNADEEETRQPRRQADPRAARLGITRRRKRNRDGTLKDVVYSEWLEQATREVQGRADIVHDDPGLVVIDFTGEEN